MAEFGRRRGARETLRGAKTAGGAAADDTSPVSPAGGAPAAGAPAAGPEREVTVEARSQWKTVVRRFLRHKLARVSLVVLLFVMLLAFVGGHIWQYGYSETVLSDTSNHPSLHAPVRCKGGKSSTIDSTGIEHACAPHLFGTDSLGKDVFAQVLRGAQKSLQIAFMVAFLSTVLGVVIGAIAGFYRGWVDMILMRITDLLLTIPVIVVAACLGRKVRGGDWWLLGLILAGLVWTTLARIIRGEFLSLREKEFVEAAKALGASDRRIIFKHMLPNVIGSITVNATLVVAAAILVETALSYLGLGVKAPDTSLGLLVSDNEGAFQTRPWLFWFPGVFILLITLSVNFVGDGLRDAFDPKQTRVRA